MSLVKERLVAVEGEGVVMAGFPRLAGGSFWSYTWCPLPRNILQAKQFEQMVSELEMYCF